MKRSIFIAVMMVAMALLATGCVTQGKESQGGFAEIGKSVTSGDVLITMEEGQVANYQARATFTIENKSSSELAIDPATSFVVKADSEGVEVKMELDKRGCGSKLIKGPVPAGGKITGDVCWRGNATDTWPAQVLIGFNGIPGAEGVVAWKLVVE